MGRRPGELLLECMFLSLVSLDKGLGVGDRPRDRSWGPPILQRMAGRRRGILCQLRRQAATHDRPVTKPALPRWLRNLKVLILRAHSAADRNKNAAAASAVAGSGPAVGGAGRARKRH